MIDLHSHILFDIDDGAADLSESLSMCRTAVENRIEEIVATPHFEKDVDTEEYLALRDERLAALRAAAEREELPVEIYPGAEVALDPRLYERRNDLKRLALPGGKYLLTELPFTPISRRELFGYLDLIYGEELIPLIAHPERYDWVLNEWDILNELLEYGALFQVTTHSLLGAFGRPAQELSFAMLRADAIDVIATDAHEDFGIRTNQMMRCVQFLSRFLPSGQIERMAETTPAYILRGRDVPEREIRRIGENY